VAKSVTYWTLRGEPRRTGAAASPLASLYERATQPAGIVATIIITVTVGYRELLKLFQRIATGDPSAVLEGLLVLLSFVAGLRLFQSLLLAKRDYVNVAHDFGDIVTFVLIALFTGGVFGSVFGHAALMFGSTNSQLVVLYLYTVCAFGGAVNFYRLRFRLRNQPDRVDYPTESYIQTVNIAVFTFVAICLAYATVEVQRNGPTNVAFVAISLTYIPLIFDMVHSSQLTYLPKFLLRNDLDSPKRRIAKFREQFRRTAAELSDEEVLRFIGRDVHDIKIQTVRVTRHDAGEIADHLANEFGYVFECIFGSTDRKRIREALVRLLTAAGGLGSFGFMSFYAIEHIVSKRERHRIGFAKIDSSKGCWIYRIAEIWTLGFTLMRLFGVTRLPGILRRARQMARLQPEATPNEIRLTYLLIHPDHRRRGFSAAFLTMLANALIHTDTGDIAADRITLVVREHNTAARRLFESEGFVPLDRVDRGVDDPFAADEKIGKAIAMEYSKSVDGDDN
jgi:ribosomal protein S18 acetylase RimI-like enzyme